MSWRMAAGAWLAALALVAGGAAGLLRLAPPDRHPVGNASIAVIGSSLTFHAVARRGGGDSSLLGDGARHVRLAVNGMTEARALEVSRLAIEDGAGLLVLEINPFIVSTPNSPTGSECDGWLSRFRGLAGSARRQLVDSFRQFLDAQPSGGWLDEPPNMDRGQTIRPGLFETVYPLVPRDPSCGTELAALVDLARRNGAEIVFFLPTRSQRAHDYLGPAITGEIPARAELLAEQAGVPLFAPQGPWPDEMFLDHAHMNQAGRARLAAEFRQWWQARRP